MKIGDKDIQNILLGDTNVIRCYLGDKIVYQGLPSGYQKVEYIENTSLLGGFDTGMKMSITDYSIEAKFKMIESSSAIICGTNTTADTGHFSYYCNISDDALKVRANRHDSIWAVNHTISTPLDSAIHVVKFEGNALGCTISWDEENTASYQYTNPAQYSADNLFIFGRSSTGNPFMGRIYYIKLWNTTTKARLFDYIPCVYKSDNTPGFYDLVSNEFKTITNASTKWKAGPDV